ncbi:MAG TPA: hypothetical protein VFG10_03840 [Saprospiraceae bacterium]|nr:hypothetical protein [Saprospiraceae bacterium]
MTNTFVYTRRYAPKIIANYAYSDMTRIFIFFFLLSHFFACSQTSEQGLFIFDVYTQKTTWLDENGRVIRVFEKDQIPKLKAGQQKDRITEFFLQNYKIHHFKIGHLPVRYNDAWRFYNSRGQWMFSLDTAYLDISLASDGYYLATVTDTTDRKQYIYIDPAGKLLFQGKTFTKTTEFRNHIAFAEKNNIWYILKAKNNSCVPIENEELASVYDIKRNTELYSVAALKTLQGGKNVIIDTMAHIIYSASMCSDNPFASIASINDQLIICGQTKKIFFYDMQWNELAELEDVYGLDDLGDELILLEMQNGEKKLFDFKMHPVVLNVPSHWTYTYSGISQRFIVANVQDTITGTTFFGLFDGKSKTIVHQMAEDNFGGLMGDRIIYSDLNGGRIEFTALKNLKGNILYAKRNKEKIYNIAIAGYFPKTDIEGLMVVHDEDLKKLSEYGQIKTLEFRDCQFEKLPACICQFRNLKSLTIKTCEKLISLPDCLGKLPYFDDLLIEDCTSLKTLEDFLLHFPGKLEINTDGHYFHEGFNKIIEEKLPNIKLTSWTDNWFLNNQD